MGSLERISLCMLWMSFEFQGLKRYVWVVHLGEKLFLCSVCIIAFTVITSLRIHTRTHTGEQPFGCKICGVQFADTYARYVFLASWKQCLISFFLSLSICIVRHTFSTIVVQFVDMLDHTFWVFIQFLLTWKKKANTLQTLLVFPQNLCELCSNGLCFI